mmetsp:Transcript_455/g.933  ORF Transcript_455/g.933 Transcript_455/m.933 type:complete len:354 (-) Transcript_455:247-1308(-)
MSIKGSSDVHRAGVHQSMAGIVPARGSDFCPLPCICMASSSSDPEDEDEQDDESSDDPPSSMIFLAAFSNSGVDEEVAVAPAMLEPALQSAAPSSPLLLSPELPSLSSTLPAASCPTSAMACCLAAGSSGTLSTSANLAASFAFFFFSSLLLVIVAAAVMHSSSDSSESSEPCMRACLCCSSISRSAPTGTSTCPAEPPSCTVCTASPAGSSTSLYLCACFTLAVTMSTCWPSSPSLEVNQMASLATFSIFFRSSFRDAIYSAVPAAGSSVLPASTASGLGTTLRQCNRYRAPRPSASMTFCLRSIFSAFSAALAFSSSCFRTIFIIFLSEAGASATDDPATMRLLVRTLDAL